MSEEELSYLLKVSYSNNDALYDIDQKIRDNEELIEDLSLLLNMRDAKDVWTKTTLNMVLMSGLFTGMSKLIFDVSDKDLRFMLASLTVSSIVLGYVKYREEIAKQKKLKDMALKNDKVNKVSRYSVEQLEDAKKEQKALLEMRNKLIERELEIRGQLSSEKKLIKK